MATHWQGERQEVKGQAWGCVSLPDVLLLLEVKYDVVTNLLYREMLQEHHSKKSELKRELTHLCTIEHGLVILHFYFLPASLIDSTALCIWENLLPWQQHKEHEELEDLAEEILVSGDMLHLAEMPGAFRMYR